MPTATPMSYCPERMASAVSWSAVAAVAQPLKTSMNGMPVRPSRPVTASGLSTSKLPPNANWTSFHSTPASAERSPDRVGAHVDRRLGAEPAERVQPHPDDRNVVHLRLLSLGVARQTGANA